MAEQDSGQERTEEPTPKRREDARKNGQVLRAREFNTLIMMFAASITVYLFGGRIGESCQALMRDLLTLEREMAYDRALAITQAFAVAELFLFAQIPLAVPNGHPPAHLPINRGRIHNSEMLPVRRKARSRY